MIDAGFVPMLAATAGVVGGLGLAWRAGVLRSMRAHVSREAAAREHGWSYAALPHGWQLAGRTLTCRWTLRCDAHYGAGAVRFSLGAPDERCAIAAFGSGHAPGALAHSQGWPRHASECTAHTRGLWIEASTVEDVGRIADPEVARLVHDFLAAVGTGCGLRAWMSPHGVEIGCQEPLARWEQIEALARLGLALGRRAGLA
jgi:hypothetical protein